MFLPVWTSWLKVKSEDGAVRLNTLKNILTFGTCSWNPVDCLCHCFVLVAAAVVDASVPAWPLWWICARQTLSTGGSQQNVSGPGLAWFLCPPPNSISSEHTASTEPPDPLSEPIRLEPTQRSSTPGSRSTRSRKTHLSIKPTARPDDERDEMPDE